MTTSIRKQTLQNEQIKKLEIQVDQFYPQLKQTKNKLNHLSHSLHSIEIAEYRATAFKHPTTKSKCKH